MASGYTKVKHVPTFCNATVKDLAQGTVTAVELVSAAQGYANLKANVIKKPTLRAGNLTVPNPENPAKMDLNFPSTTKDLWIVDTDYKTYLATWNCKENYFGHYQTASIMSRERKMDPKLLKKVRNIFAQYHINTYDFNYIGQKDCPDLQTIRRDGVLFPL
ncbi:hypothetical protein GQR58_015169 [Nymphon striatum]|nr:hypothetical protein GQR58_015169 [Nymphon striatum]